MILNHSFLARCAISFVPNRHSLGAVEKEIIKSAIIEAVKMAGSQKALAIKAELTQGAISKYVLGKAKPRGEIALALEKACENKIHRSRFAPHIFKEDNSNAA